MSDRPQPELDRFLQMTIPPEDLAELAGWLAELVDRREGRAPPGTARQYPVTEKLRAYAGKARQGAREHAGRRAALAAPTVSAASVVALAQATRESAADEVTTAEAAALLGVSAERARQLAASGKVRARRTAHRAWLLDRAEVTAMTTGKDADGAHGSTAQDRAGSGSAA